MSRVGLVLVALFVADVLSTAWALSAGAQEANPFVRSLLVSGGYTTWIVTKAVLTALAFAGYRILEPRRFAELSANVHRVIRLQNGSPVTPKLLRWARIAGAGAPALFMALVCVNNAVLALRLTATA